MKTISLAAACIALLPLSAIAQPVITQSGVAPNLHAEFYYAEATGFNPGNAGPNQIWDYSNLNVMFLGTDTAIPVAGSPYASMFPTATYLYKYSGMFVDDSYFYNNVTPTKFEILSLGYDGENGDVFTGNPKTYVTFPYTYQTVFTDTYQIESNPEPIFSFTATYDAYGTLITPLGTFNNVVRQKVVEDGQVNYNWFNVSPFFPILQTVLEENVLGLMKDLTVLGVDDVASKSFTAFPNPVRDVVNVTLGDYAGKVEISLSDVTGKTVVQKSFTANGSALSIDMSALKPGIYFMQVAPSSGSAFIRKIVKS